MVWKQLVFLQYYYVRIVLKATVHKKFQTVTSESQLRGSRLQMFFKIGVSQKFYKRNTLVPESLFNKVEGLKVHNFMKKRFKNRCFCLWILRNIWEQPFLQNTSDGCFCQFEKVTVQYWGLIIYWVPSLVRSNTQCGMVSTKKICGSSQSRFLTYY